MKKTLLTILLFCLVLFPIKGIASEKYYKESNTSNFVEILEEEGMELKNKDYKETDNQVTIYVFRGIGCDFCKGFLNYLNDLSVDHGDKFKVVGFESWQNEENWALLEEVSAYMGEPADGVPYIIIGESVIPGYIADFNEEILATIEYQYEQDVDDRYDVFEEMQSEITKQKVLNVLSIIGKVVLILVIALAFILYFRCENKKLHKELQDLKLEVEKLNKSLSKTSKK